MSPDIHAMVPTVVARLVDGPVFLGEGGMGQVWRGRLRSDGTEVAVKVVRDVLLERPAVLARFRREAAVMGRVRHPGVVRLRSFEEGPDGLAIVLDFIEGAPLSSVLADGPLDPATALALGREMAAALQAVHAAGLIHRDLKAENVMRRLDGSFVLMDFGLAGFLDQGEVTAMTRTGQLVGTLPWMAPEVLLGGKATVLSDQYQLGLLLHLALTGEMASSGEGLLALVQGAVGGGPGPFRGPAGAAVPLPLRRAVERALARTPASRHRDLAAFVEALSASAPVASGALEDEVAMARRRGRRTAALVLVLVGVAVGGLAVEPRWRPEEPSQVSSPTPTSPGSVDGAREVYAAALAAQVAEGRDRASDPDLRRPPARLDPVWVHDLVLAHMRRRLPGAEGVSGLEDLDRERSRMVGLVDLAMRGPEPPEDEGMRLAVSYVDQTRRVVHRLHSCERDVMRRAAGDPVAKALAETGRVAVTERFVDDLLALERREREAGREAAGWTLALVEALLTVGRRAEAIELVAAVPRRLPPPGAYPRTWAGVLYICGLRVHAGARIWEGDWQEICAVLDDADTFVQVYRGPADAREAARRQLAHLQREGLAALIEGVVMPAEGRAEGVRRVGPVLAAFNEPAYVPLLHGPLIRFLDRAGFEEAAAGLGARHAWTLSAAKGLPPWAPWEP